MNTPIHLDKEHYDKLVKRAQSLGKSPEDYLRSLIDAQSPVVEELVSPARQNFSSMTDDQLDELFERTRRQPRRDALAGRDRDQRKP